MSVYSGLGAESLHPLSPLTTTLNYGVIRPDGAICWIHDRAFPIVSDSGTIQRVVGIAEDVTERKKASAEIGANEGRFRSIAHSTSDALILADVEGRVTFWNAAAQRMFGYAEAEIMVRPVALLMPMLNWTLRWGLWNFGR